MKIQSYDFTTLPPVENWINGEWVSTASGESMDVVNPRFCKVMTTVVLSQAEDVAVAVASSKAAFAVWSKTPIKERVQVFYGLKQLMERDFDQLSWLIVVPDADVEMTAQNVAASFTGCAGQRCMAASVVVAVGDVDHIIKRIVERAAEIELGTDVGTIINKESDYESGPKWITALVFC